MTTTTIDKSRLSGIYQGVCTRVRGREIKAKIPLVTGNNESAWAKPCVPPGWWDQLHIDHVRGGHAQMVGTGIHSHVHTLRQITPLPGEVVWFMFENGEPESPVWMGIL